MFKRHFRFCYFTKHPAYIVAETEAAYVYLSITHAPYFNGHKCISMRDGSYLVPVVMVADKNYFSKCRKGRYKFTRADGPIIRDILKGKVLC